MNKFLIFLLFIICIATVIYSIFIEPNMLKIQKYNISDDMLKGIKLVFVSDFHIKTYQEKRLKKVIDAINEQNADIVLSSGDYVAGHKLKSTLPVEKIAEYISQIKSKQGYYTTLGNHDNWIGEGSITAALEKYGIKILKNENIPVKIGEKTIYIAGIEDLQTGNPSVFNALKDINNPVILLSHNPDMFTEVPSNVNLTLAGHTHGGQIRLPFIGALIVPSMYGNRYAAGYIEEEGRRMIVSRGIGTSILPVRFNCKPEIVVIEFK